MHPLPIIRDGEGDFDAGCNRPTQKVLHRVCRTLDAPVIENLQDTRELETGGGSPIDSEGVPLIDTCLRAQERAPERRSRLVNPEPPPPTPPCTDAPTGTISVSPNPVCIGATTATLSWTSLLASSASLDGVVVGLSGSMEVAPEETTTYRLVLSNSCGITRLSATLEVEDCAPIVEPPVVTYDPCSAVVTTTWGLVEGATGFLVEISDSETGPWEQYISIPDDGTVETISIGNYFGGTKWLRFSVAYTAGMTTLLSVFYTFQPLAPVVKPPAFVSISGAGVRLYDSPNPMRFLAPSGVDGATVSVVSSRENPLIGLDSTYIEVHSRKEALLDGSFPGIVGGNWSQPDGKTVRFSSDNTVPATVASGFANAAGFQISTDGFAHILRACAFDGSCRSPQIAVLVDKRTVLGIDNSRGWSGGGSTITTVVGVGSPSVPTDGGTARELACDSAYGTPTLSFDSSRFYRHSTGSVFQSHINVPSPDGTDFYIETAGIFEARSFVWTGANQWAGFPANLWANFYFRYYQTGDPYPGFPAGTTVYSEGVQNLTGGAGTRADLQLAIYALVQPWTGDAGTCSLNPLSFDLGHNLLDVVTSREDDFPT